LSLAIVFVLLTDGFMVLVLFRLRSREPSAPFRTPFYPAVPLAFLGVYTLLFIAAVMQQPGLSAAAVGALAATYASFRLFSSTA